MKMQLAETERNLRRQHRERVAQVLLQTQVAATYREAYTLAGPLTAKWNTIKTVVEG